MSSKGERIPPVFGNYEDKYHTRGAIKKFLVNGFLRTLDQFLRSLEVKRTNRICEVGCGEGELLKRLRAVFPQASLAACDLSVDGLAQAAQNCKGIPVDFSIQNAEELSGYADGGFDLVVCCEVLEHLIDPHKGLAEVLRISRGHVLVSVPNEPLWRVLNLARGKYIRHLGNTPGHVNHWSASQFQKLLRSLPGWTMRKRALPLPWQFYLLERQPVEAK